MVQLSHPYTTTGKTMAWTIRTFAGKVMSLLFNMLSRFVIVFWIYRGILKRELILLNCGVIHWKDWCWSWSSNTLATWCEELTLWKRPCCWARLKVGGEGDDRGWDGLMASLSLWWHHKLMASHELAQTHGHEFEQALEVGGGQGSLACCSPWGRKESDTTEQLNCTEKENIIDTG